MSSDESLLLAATEPDVDLSGERQRQAQRRSHRGVLAAVSTGGAVGAVARYGASLVWPTANGAFPWTTLVVNALGCLAIGCLLVAVTEVWSPHRLVRPFLGTGLLGGFTTFSTYCVDVERLIDEGRVATALTYLAATAVAALAAVTTGAWSTRRILGKRSGR